MRYTGNLETVHFTNWLIHSGRFDIGELIGEATIEAEKAFALAESKGHLGKDDDPFDWLESEVHEQLACALHHKLDELVGDLFPDSCGREDLPCFDKVGDPKWNTDDPLDLFGPYVASALDNINLDLAASELLAEYAKRQAGHPVKLSKRITAVMESALSDAENGDLDLLEMLGGIAAAVEQPLTPIDDEDREAAALVFEFIKKLKGKIDSLPAVA